jgi:hypothetical protein
MPAMRSVVRPRTISAARCRSPVLALSFSARGSLVNVVPKRRKLTIESSSPRCSRARISRLRRDTHSPHFDPSSDDGCAASSAGNPASSCSRIGFASEYENRSRRGRALYLNGRRAHDPNGANPERAEASQETKSHEYRKNGPAGSRPDHGRIVASSHPAAWYDSQAS